MLLGSRFVEKLSAIHECWPALFYEGFNDEVMFYVTQPQNKV